MSRQLTSAQYHQLRLDPHVNLSRGYLWRYTYSNLLTAGGTDTVRIVCGALPVGLFNIDMQTDGARGILVEFFAGGVVGFGQPVEGFPVAHDQFKASPFAAIEDSAFVQTPGTKIGEFLLDTTLRAGGGAVEFPIAVWAKDGDYYLTITNLHNQSATIRLALEAGAVDERVDTL